MGSKAPTTTSTTSIPPQVLAQYQNVIGKANDVASTPYQAYTGQLTAGINQAQQTGINGIGGAIGASVPYYQEGSADVRNGYNTTAGAGQYYNQAAAGLGAATPYFQQAASTINGAQPYYSQASDYNAKSTGPLDISSYLNPYQQSVIDATMKQSAAQNAITDNQALGSAIKSGNAFGGDRAGVAQAQLASSQQLNDNSLLSSLNQANYTQALGAAQNEAARYGQAATTAAGLGNAQIQAGQGYNSIGANQLQAGLGYGTLGNSVVNQGTALANQGVAQAGLGQNYENGVVAGNTALLGAGTQAQTTDQNALNAQYQQWQNAISFPYQQTGWLSNISTGIGSGSGGTTSSVGPEPSLASQIAGGATTAAALLALKRGGVVPERASGGGVGQGFPMAGGPIDFTGTPGGGGLIPNIQINQGRVNAPAGVNPNAGQSQNSAQDFSKAAGSLKNSWDGFQASQRVGQAIPDSFSATSFGGANGPMPLVGFAQGGVIPHGWASGGVPSFDDRWAPVDDALTDLTFQPGQVVQPGLAPPIAPAAPRDPLGPTDPNAAPFRLDGGYRDQPGNAEPLTEKQAAMRFNGDDMPSTGLGLPPEIARGMSRPQPAVEPASSALAYDGGLAPTGIAPPEVRARNAGLVPDRRPDGTQPASGLMGGLGITEDGRQALLSLGLGLLANKSPNFGTALGEAGLGAVGTLNEIQKQRVAQTEKDRDYGLQVQKLNQAADAAKLAAASGPMVLDQNGKAVVNPAYIKLQQTLLNLKDKDPEKIRILQAAGIDPKTPEGRALLFPKENADAEGKLVPAGGVLIKNGQAVYSNRATANLDPETLSGMAGQYLAGDRTVMQNLGRGAQGAENIVALRSEIARQAKEQGIDPRGVVDRFNEQAGALAGQRSIGTRSANISLAANEANNMIPIALKASEAVPRTQYMPINQAIQTMQKGASSPELARFVAATNSLVNAYVRAVSPSGVPTDSMRQHAYEMLNAAQSHQAYSAVTAIMQDEMKAALQAPSQVKAELRAAGREGGDHAGSSPEPAKVASSLAAPAAAVSMLKSNPALKDAFDQKYGAGAAARVLGQ